MASELDSSDDGSSGGFDLGDLLGSTDASAGGPTSDIFSGFDAAASQIDADTSSALEGVFGSTQTGSPSSAASPLAAVAKLAAPFIAPKPAAQSSNSSTIIIIAGVAGLALLLLFVAAE